MSPLSSYNKAIKSANPIKIHGKRRIKKEDEAEEVIKEVREYLRNPALHTKLTRGQKAADKLTIFAGSWTFIIIFFAFLGIWMLTNAYFLVKYANNSFDPFPFILLNLILSCLAAIQAPVILMSQNREAQRDRLRSEYDYQVNRKAEREIQDMQQDLEQIKKLIKSKI